QALDEVSFHIPSGTYVAIIGHTGSGKSTLFQNLNGLVRPSKGEVQIGEFTLTKEDKPSDMKELRSRVGVVCQYPEHQLFEETIREDIAFGPKNFGVPPEEVEKRIKEVIPPVGLMEDFLNRSAFALSAGQMRRVPM